MIIVFAFLASGYDLMKLVSQDILEYPDDYGEDSLNRYEITRHYRFT